MVLSLEPVVTLAGVERVDPDQQIGPVSGDAQPPGSWFGGGGEGESGAVPGAGPGSLPMAFRFGPGAPVPDGMSLPVGDGDAPRRVRAGRGRVRQVPRQPR